MQNEYEVCFDFDFDFCLSTSIPVLTTSTYVVAWPQGDQILGGGLVAQGHGRTSEPGKHKKKYPRRGREKNMIKGGTT